MCLVIDTCCFADVFDGESKRHAKFAAILDWINGNGRMIYGGTKYNAELRKAWKYLSYVTELSRSGRAIQMSTATIDRISRELKEEYPSPQFNDEHIVALVIASRCCVVCTDDAIAISYLRDIRVFSKRGVSRPSIYRGHKNHKRLCCDEKIVGVCRG